MIPKVIHFIFFGFTKFEYIHYLAIKSAVDVHSDYLIKLHYAKEPTDNILWDEIKNYVELIYCEPPEEINGVKLESYQYKADVKRLEILLAQGGVYMDIDIISLKPFGDLINNSCVLGVEAAADPDTVDLNQAQSITNAVMLAEPNHQFIKDLLSETAANIQDKPWAYHAVTLPLELLRQRSYDLKLLPRKSFMPFDFRTNYIFQQDQSKLKNLEDSYTIHLWETIWKDQLDQINKQYLKTSTSLFAQLCKSYGESKRMPTSSKKGKSWTEQKLKHLATRFTIKNVLDIGAGAGTYWELYHKVIGKNWTAVEVWPEYIEKYQLAAKYNTVINQDVRTIDWSKQQQDLVIAGDVLEHMTKVEAEALVSNVLNNSQCLLISIPIIDMPQGAWEGNPFEAHVKDDWSDDEVKSTFGSLIVDSVADEEIGVYILSKDPKFKERYFKLRIAVYTICKNESKFVERWAASNTEADLRLVCDTGSTDDTVNLLKANNVRVQSIKVLPWRFDVARGTALNLLPADIDVCIWQDLDEELLPGWRQQLEQHWQADTTIANHRYRNNNGAWQWHSKIHARHNCRWTGAVHETLVWYVPESAIWIPELYLDEHQDLGKTRSNYLHLLERKILEGDTNWRTYAFLAGEYEVVNNLEQALAARLTSYENCNEGEIVKSWAARQVGSVYIKMQNANLAERWFKRATEHSEEREAWYALAEFYHNNQRWDECYLSAQRCLNIKDRRDGFTYMAAAWGALAYDYIALAAYNLGLYNRALDYGKQALALSPQDQRLKNNLSFYQDKADIPLPEVLEIETSSGCNRTCGACIRNSHPDRTKVQDWFEDKLMPMEMIEMIFAQAQAIGFNKDLGLSHYNEPLTDPRIVDILTLAKKFNFRNVFFHSNGDLLTEELAANIDGLATWIVFGIYADSPAKERRQSQIKSWFKKTQVRFTSGELGLTHFGPAENMSEIITSVENLPCHEPQDRFIINHRGEMEFCCDDLGGNFDLGVVSHDNTLQDLWFNKRFQRMVKQLTKDGGRKGLAYCETCPRPKQQNFKAKNIKVVAYEAS